MGVSGPSNEGVYDSIYNFHCHLGLEVVHVGAEGWNVESCGASSSPCRHLSAGVERVSDGGVIIITGTQVLNETINVNKSLHITSTEGGRGGRAIITGDVEFAFNISVPFHPVIQLSNYPVIQLSSYPVIQLSCNPSYLVILLSS